MPRTRGAGACPELRQGPFSSSGLSITARIFSIVRGVSGRGGAAGGGLGLATMSTGLAGISPRTAARLRIAESRCSASADASGVRVRRVRPARRTALPALLAARASPRRLSRKPDGPYCLCGTSTVTVSAGVMSVYRVRSVRTGMALSRISAIQAGTKDGAVPATVEKAASDGYGARRSCQRATSAPIMTVRFLGSPKWLIGLDALRAMAMKSCLRQRCIPGASLGVIAIRETK